MWLGCKHRHSRACSCHTYCLLILLHVLAIGHAVRELGDLLSHCRIQRLVRDGRFDREDGLDDGPAHAGAQLVVDLHDLRGRELGLGGNFLPRRRLLEDRREARAEVVALDLALLRAVAQVLEHVDEGLRKFENGLDAAEMRQQLDEERLLLMQYDSLKLHHNNNKQEHV